MNTSNHFFSLISFKGSILQNRLKTYSTSELADADTVAFFDDLICYFDNPDLISANEFYEYDINTLVPYLKACHTDYLENQIPLILNSLENLRYKNGTNHPFLVHAPVLFSSFFNDLVSHIALEEKKLYPYALMLNNHLTLSDISYSTVQFENDHETHKLYFDDLIKIVNQYADDFKADFAFNQLQSRLNTLIEDLGLHELLEDNVLIPKLKEIEHKLGLLH